MNDELNAEEWTGWGTTPAEAVAAYFGQRISHHELRGALRMLGLRLVDAGELADLQRAVDEAGLRRPPRPVADPRAR